MLDLVHLSPTIGAEVRGLDLAAPLDDKTHRLLLEALHTWKVPFFRDQDLTRAQHIAFARRFGHRAGRAVEVRRPRRSGGLAVTGRERLDATHAQLGELGGDLRADLAQADDADLGRSPRAW